MFLACRCKQTTHQPALCAEASLWGTWQDATSGIQLQGESMFLACRCKQTTYFPALCAEASLRDQEGLSPQVASFRVAVWLCAQVQAVRHTSHPCMPRPAWATKKGRHLREQASGWDYVSCVQVQADDHACPPCVPMLAWGTGMVAVSRSQAQGNIYKWLRGAEPQHSPGVCCTSIFDLRNFLFLNIIFQKKDSKLCTLGKLGFIPAPPPPTKKTFSISLFFKIWGSHLVSLFYFFPDNSAWIHLNGNFG